MKPETLSIIKSDLGKLLMVVELLANQFDNFIILKVIAIMLHNASSDRSDCSNYNHERAVNYIRQTNKTLKGIAKYESNFYVIVYISEQYDMIVTGHEMSELNID